MRREEIKGTYIVDVIQDGRRMRGRRPELRSPS